ncbi:unnamed protein product, partial [Coregonus sp. 'balchen']
TGEGRKIPTPSFHKSHPRTGGGEKDPNSKFPQISPQDWGRGERSQLQVSPNLTPGLGEGRKIPTPSFPKSHPRTGGGEKDPNSKFPKSHPRTGGGEKDPNSKFPQISPQDWGRGERSQLQVSPNLTPGLGEGRKIPTPSFPQISPQGLGEGKKDPNSKFPQISPQDWGRGERSQLQVSPNLTPGLGEGRKIPTPSFPKSHPRTGGGEKIPTPSFPKSHPRTGGGEKDPNSKFPQISPQDWRRGTFARTSRTMWSRSMRCWRQSSPLKLLSYSVNIIVDIRSVQLLWHQLRVSVLVLKERLLQGLQDSNGNYTRQTDILQAFSQDQQQARLDALTEVDDCGQLTIKCSQDYFSLDCGITAYELSDYSPSEDQEGTSGSGQGQEPCCSYPSLERDFPELIQSVDLLTIAAKQSQSQGAIPEQEEEGPGTPIEKHRDTTSSTGEENNPAPGPKMHCGTPQSESTPLSKRPLQGSVSNEVSPTQPALPKKPMYLEGETESSLSLRRSTLPPSLQFQGDLSRSTPSLLDPPDRSKFWLELNAVYPSNASQSYDSLQAMNSRNLQASRQREAGGYQRPRSPVGAQIPLQRSSSEAGQGGHFPQDLSSIPTLFSGNRGCSRALEDPQTDRDTDSPLPSAMREPSDHESHNKASSEDFHPPTKEAVWIIQPQCPHLHHPATASAEASPNPSEEHWFGSDEFLALPAQLKKTEMLAMKLETLAQRPGHQGHHESIQDVDDWELTEVNSDWEGEGPGSPQPPLGFHALQHPYKRPFRVGMGRFSPTSSSDMAPSLDESIESGPLSDLLSEDEAWSSRESRMRDNNRGWSSGETRGSSTGSRRRDANRSLPLQPTTTTPTTMAPHIERQCKPLIQQLLDDIQHHDNHPDIWGKIEGFVSKLDEFILLAEGSPGVPQRNWMPPKAEMDSLKLYLETHLSSHRSLREGGEEEERSEARGPRSSGFIL